MSQPGLGEGGRGRKASVGRISAVVAFEREMGAKESPFHAHAKVIAGGLKPVRAPPQVQVEVG